MTTSTICSNTSAKGLSPRSRPPRPSPPPHLPRLPPPLGWVRATGTERPRPEEPRQCGECDGASSNGHRHCRSPDTSPPRVLRLLLRRHFASALTFFSFLFSPSSHGHEGTTSEEGERGGVDAVRPRQPRVTPPQGLRSAARCGHSAAARSPSCRGAGRSSCGGAICRRSVQGRAPPPPWPWCWCSVPVGRRSAARCGTTQLPGP